MAEDILRAPSDIRGNDLSAYERIANKNVPGGYAGLTPQGVVDHTNIPSDVAFSNAAGASRLKLRNDQQNPRALALTNWAKTDPAAGATNITWTDVDDADFAVPGSAATGHCAEYHLTHDGSAGRTIEIRVNPAFFVPVAYLGQIIFHSISVKQVVAPVGADVGVTLSHRNFNNASVAVSTNVIATAKRITPNTGSNLMRLEGFDQVGAGTDVGGGKAGISEVVTIQLPAVAGDYTVRVGKAMTTVDPITEVPEYIDGTRWNCAWQAATNASQTDGWVNPPAQGSLKYWGYHSNDQSSNHYFQGQAVASPQQHADLIEEAGGNAARWGLQGSDLDATWNGGNPKPRAVAAFANLYDEYRKRGIKACFCLGLPAFATTGGTYLPTNGDVTQMGNVAKLINAIITEWSDVVVGVEFLNEPNYNSVWGGAPDAAKYTAMLKPLYTAIKTAHPSVKVGVAGLAQYAADDANAIVASEFLTGIYTAGGKGFFDFIGAHPYPANPSTALPTPGNNAVGGFDAYMTGLREVRHANGDTVPFWITEIGGISSAANWTELNHAQTMLLLRGICRRANDVEFMTFHTLIGDLTMTTSARDFQHVDYQTLRRKPAFRALRDNIVPGGSWRPLILVNSWQPANTGNDSPPMWCEDWRKNMCRVRGAVKSGATSTSQIASLPRRPRFQTIIPARQVSAGTVANIGTNANNPAVVYVFSTGVLIPVVNTSTTYLEFEGEYEIES